jgi:transposase
MQAASDIVQPVPDYKALYEAERMANAELRQQVESLKVHLLQLQKAIFGSKHERFVPQQGQGMINGSLFEVEPIADILTETKELPAREITKTTLVSKHQGRNEFPASLRREEAMITPAHFDPERMKEIGRDVTERLAYTPCELYVKRIVRPRYVITGTSAIVQAPAPEQAIEKSNADSSLLAQIVVEKYVDHLPLYRQVNRYKRLGVTISESTIGDWVAAVAKVLTPLYEEHKALILASGYLHADETVIKVMDSEKKNATHQGYYWVYQSHHEKLVLFDYNPSRGRQGPESILKGYSGYLQTDGYQVYESIGESPHITLLHCWAHARRKFSEARQNDKDRAEYALAEIQKLYAIERHAAQEALDVEALTAYRQQHALPVLEQLFAWMHKAYTEVLPKSAIGQALAYSIQRKQSLSLYAYQGLLNIDNNPVENSIRPVAIGRKNYLFAGSHAAAQRAAVFYSLLATCKVHAVNPYTWLADILDRINAYKQSRIQELLPQHWKPQKQ